MRSSRPVSSTESQPYHHGDLRQALLDRAAEVIQTKGIEALTLRGLARDLGVSHGAPNRHFSNKAQLLTTLATEGYARLIRATLEAADQVTDDPWVRLNAMGQGYIHWALDNPARFNAIMHPDLDFYESSELREAMEDFGQTIHDAVTATQLAGRHQGVDIETLNLFTISVPMGASTLLAGRNHSIDLTTRKSLVADLIELVVPIKNRV